MKKKTITIILALALCLSLAACGSGEQAPATKSSEPAGDTQAESPASLAANTPETVPQCDHDWIAASCLEPKTCSKCGETEGGPLAHDWAEASCQEPKTCSRCGETEGDPLTHDWKEANYQAPITCTLCGETEGEPIPPYFLSLGYEISSFDSRLDYKTVCWNNRSKVTMGEVTISGYRVIESDYAHEAREGYEWRIVRANVVFRDNNAQSYGTRTRIDLLDYYSGFPDITNTDSDEGGTRTEIEKYDASYYGDDCEIISIPESTRSEWVGTAYYSEYVFSFQVPIGYDGAMFVFYNAGNFGNADEKPLPELVDGDSLFFRLK